MSPLHAILFGIIQGLTEFLPISSTAHLTLTGKLLGYTENPEAWTAFMAVIQLGTVAAVIAYFRKDIISMTAAFFRDAFSGKGFRGFSRDGKLALYVILGTLPVALVGLELHKIIEGAVTKSTLVIISSLVALAALLWLAEKLASHTRRIDQTTWKDALIIGLAQVCALIPGSSRSGTTITAALFLGFVREDGARFSFLLSIPAVLASGIYEMTKIHPGVFEFGISNLVIATAVSTVSGYLAIAWLLKYLMKNTTMAFVWYRFALGILLTAFLMLGLIEP